MTSPTDLADYRERREAGIAIPSETERQAAMWTQGLEAKARAAALVSRHPDLAEKLTAGPLSFTSPALWNGYVPPRQWGGALNTSPQRRALVEICAEAWRRENPTSV
ncbi:hypothetical protein [Parafrankia sp. EUN1f]|uniref:hypothetical protein n=1 Tax=Parafrankia sp. EUN1f TaxID=102897 RepID=UPI0001C47476|nr:hypothetical protein [Parafrankia sp. EUN1f]EFC80072.1 hypothetical protein FrEUN1fDRAFT_6799 [Parafrankia sp. EUN1f]